MTSTNRTRAMQPSIVVPFFTDCHGNYNIREFTNHPIVWADKDYLNLFNDFDKRLIKQHNNVDKETILKEMLNPCDAVISKELYTEQMGDEYLENMLEETNTEVAFSIPDAETFGQFCFSISNGAMNQLNMIAGYFDYKQLGELVNNHSIPIKVVLHKLPKNLSLSYEQLEDYTPVNVFEHIDVDSSDQYGYSTTFDVDDNHMITVDIEEYYF